MFVVVNQTQKLSALAVYNWLVQWMNKKKLLYAIHIVLQ